MAAQQAQFAIAISGLKSALRRKAELTDSDDGNLPDMGRSYNLKRKARYTREPGAAGIDGPPAWKRKIEHGGYHRNVLGLNPLKFDADGDVVEDDEYEESDPDLSPNEDNPYGEIKLEHLLAPLTSAAALPDHPSMAEAYTSKHLSTLTEESERLMRREHASLWEAKNALQTIRGDITWIPCGEIGTAYDELFLNAPYGDLSRTRTEFRNGRGSVDGSIRRKSDSPAPIRSNGLERGLAQTTNGHVHNAIVDVDMADVKGVETPNDHKTATSDRMVVVKLTSEDTVNGTVTETPSTISGAAVDGEQPQESTAPEGSNQASPADDADDDSGSQPTHRMTTRARAQVEDPSPPTTPNSIPAIHPFFDFPTDILPDTDFGLPPQEAEETRQCLLIFVQKHEEIVRCSEELNADLVKANRMRKDVLAWCKAEGHIGEMSDGEDWYDKEEWGLDDDLIKGRDEEEDEPATVAKKTRQRRRADDK
ncbi:hypothetical protein EJ05DRAFT_178283 [Pseudovirgaria hyperparasitica]|uniref:Transcriptional regulatory protein RXT2 N-terminal domain-containing protein n=1 Tax=Pseudovirgaria hyperparasitica TaxID=470096 RepID=A0A6A6WIS7_9PEZI|nr:uncharacterized protein EJ05DRAFT_178283 [Pseudovirgaria hyperparasitica]KAF2761597.1 hypothetical protein EJ05DRAFT_178283 [Pseudovirgaria hyperparasitica]